MRNAYRPPLSESDSGPHALQVTCKDSRAPKNLPVSCTLPCANPQQDSDHEVIRPHTAKPIPRFNKLGSTPSGIATSSQQRDPVTKRPPEPRPAKGPAILRARGNPSGKPAVVDRDVLPEQTSPIHRPRVAQNAAPAGDTPVLDTSEDRRVSDLEERLRQLEGDKTATDRRLEDTERNLVAARAENDTLKKEVCTLQDHLRTAEMDKARIVQLEGSIQVLEKCVRRLNETLDGKDEKIKEQELQLATQREEYGKLQKVLSEYQGAFELLAKEFERYLHEGSNMQPEVNYQQSMAQGAAFQQLQQYMDKLVNIWTQRPTGGAVNANYQLPAGNNPQSFASGPGPSVGGSIVTAQWVRLQQGKVASVLTGSEYSGAFWTG